MLKHENVEILEKVFNKKVSLIEVKKPYIVITICTDKIFKENNFLPVKEVCDLGFELRNVLTNYRPLYPQKINNFGYYLTYLVPIVLIIIELFLSVYLSFLSKRDFEPLNFWVLIIATVIYMSPIIFLYYYFSLKYLKKCGLSRAHKWGVHIMCCVWIFVSFPFIMTINGFFDKSSTKEVEFSILTKYPTENSDYDKIVLGHPNEKSFDYNITNYFKIISVFLKPNVSVETSEYKKIRPGIDKVRLYLKNGYLGIKWPEKYVIIYQNKL